MNGITRPTIIPALSLRLLGEFRLSRDEVSVTSIEGARLQSLLAYLVLHHGIPQSRTRLASLLWPDSTEAQAHTNLRKLTYLLHNALPDADRSLVVERRTLLWHGDAFRAIDVLDFKAALARAEQAEQRRDDTACACRFRGSDRPVPGRLAAGVLWRVGHRGARISVAVIPGRARTPAVPVGTGGQQCGGHRCRSPPAA